MSKKDVNVNVSSGISCGGFLAVSLTVVFVVLKLMKIIDWSWLWVLSPTWIYVVASAVITVIVLIIGLIIVFIFED